MRRTASAATRPAPPPPTRWARGPGSCCCSRRRRTRETPRPSHGCARLAGLPASRPRCGSATVPPRDAGRESARGTRHLSEPIGRGARVRRGVGPLRPATATWPTAPAAPLVALVLRKRALSSPAALAASLRHRMAWLDRRDAPVDQPLPALRRRGDRTRRRRAPGGAAAAWTGRRAVPRPRCWPPRSRPPNAPPAAWSKLRALRRLLRRTASRPGVHRVSRHAAGAVGGAVGRDHRRHAARRRAPCRARVGARPVRRRARARC